MANAKWIGGFLGLLSGGPIGALAGFVLGSLFDTVAGDDGIGHTDGRIINQQGTTDEGARNGFLFSLLTLMSYIIRADGRIMHSEMEAARQFLRQNFGEEAMREGDAVMKRLFERQRQMETAQPGSFHQTIVDCCRQLRDVLPEAQRLQILGLLAMLAKADGHVATEEIAAMREVTLELGLSEAEMNSMLGLGGSSLKDAYDVLEITPEATDDEVRQAYKHLAIKHHPDRVSALGEDVRAAAERKMQQINAAKDLIFKSRGL